MACKPITPEEAASPEHKKFLEELWKDDESKRFPFYNPKVTEDLRKIGQEEFKRLYSQEPLPNSDNCLICAFVGKCDGCAIYPNKDD